jgi:hypothetical protein
MSTHYFMSVGTHTAGPGGSIRLRPDAGASHDIDIITVVSGTTLSGTVTVSGSQTTAQITLTAAQFSQLSTDLGTAGIEVDVAFDWTSPTVSNWTEGTHALVRRAVVVQALQGLLKQLEEQPAPV